MEIAFADALIIVGYIAIILFIGFYFSSKKNSTSEYFLADRSLKWPLVGTSLFSSNISSEHFIGFAGAGYITGLAVSNYEYMGAMASLLLAWVFGSFYIRSNVYTMPEFLEKRYNAISRRFISVGSLIAYVFTKISVTLFASAIFFEEVFGLDIYSSSLFLVIATGLYSVGGGLRPIAYTQLVQTFFMIGGAIVLTVIGLHEVGGFSKLLSAAPENYFTLVRPSTAQDFPWTGVIFGIPIVTTWYHCTDQFMVQRFLSAKNIDHAKGGTIFSAYLKFLCAPLLLLPGIIAKVLFPDIHPDFAYSTMVMALLPIGIKGFVIAAFLAALMSSLAACFHSCSTLFTFDIYQKIFPTAKEFVLVNIGRLATFVIVIIAIIWVTFLRSIEGEFFIYSQSIASYFGPPITAIFFMGIVWPRVNGKSAIATLIVGFSMGITKFIVELLLKMKMISSGFIYHFANVNFLHYSIFVFLVCLIVMLSVSLLTEVPPIEKLKTTNYHYSDMPVQDFTPQMVETETGRTYNIIFTALLVFLVITVYIFFST